MILWVIVWGNIKELLNRKVIIFFSKFIYEFVFENKTKSAMNL